MLKISADARGVVLRTAMEDKEGERNKDHDKVLLTMLTALAGAWICDDPIEFNRFVTLSQLQ